MPIELDAQVLELCGADAVAFAQAQFASDLRALATGDWQWSAWLSAQGRVRCWFALLRVADDRLLLWLRGANAEAVRADLARFVFRSKFTLRVAPARVRGAAPADARAALGDEPVEQHLAGRGGMLALRLPDDARCVLFAFDDGRDAAAAGSDGAAHAAWRLADIRAGLPDLAPALQDRLLPPWLGLVRLGAISVAKGCYPGQEVMARLHFKGGNKRHLYRIEWRGAGPPAPGAELRAGGAEAGVIVVAQATATDAGRGEALAALRDEAAGDTLRTAEAAHCEIHVVSRFD